MELNILIVFQII
jgi:hypothetical protein